MPVLLPQCIVPLILTARKSNVPFVSEAGARQRMHERLLRPASFAPPERLDGVIVSRRVPQPEGWPVYDVEPTEADARPESAVVYVHGGGWVNEIVEPHWQLIARIARETGQRVVVPVYPLIPFGSARAVRDGVIALIRAELDSGVQVKLAGDSSGGQIALSAALALRDAGTVLPATVLLSPGLDLTWQNPEIEAVQPSDPWLARPGGRVLADEWRAGDALEDPAVSTLFGDMRGLGPLTIVTGARDVLNPDAHVLRRKARAQGVPVSWHEGRGQLHVFALLPTWAGDQGARVIVSSLN